MRSMISFLAIMLVSLSLGSIISCASSSSSSSSANSSASSNTKPTTTNGTNSSSGSHDKKLPVLMGEISWKDWQKNAQWDSYKPPASYTTNPAFTARIEEDVRATDVNLSFLLFSGSWCEDSQTELPKFFALAEAAAVPAEKITMIGVDENKFEPSGLAAKYGIYKVPTLIALKNGKEIGRIIEKPRTSWELDVIVIIER
jgi:thiol-disulfide isomerase/thioredoxin